MQNIPFRIEPFIDALVVELDKTRETLAVKAINKPLSYTVKDMALDLQIFPTYDGDQVMFTAARPGEQGSSKITIQLSSITDQQVRATSKAPVTNKDDIKIDNINVDDNTKKTLRKIGVTSVSDLEDLEKKNVNIEEVAPEKIDYSKLANIIRQAKRQNNPPMVRSVSMSKDEGIPVLVLEGKNLAVNSDFKPVAVINNQIAEVLSYDSSSISIAIDKNHLTKNENELVVTADPYSVFKVTIKK
jgi:hypothetical protein